MTSRDRVRDIPRRRFLELGVKGGVALAATHPVDHHAFHRPHAEIGGQRGVHGHDAEDADLAAISAEEHEVTLYAQRPVVGTEAVAVERVKLGTETVTETETVGGDVRKEQIEFDTTEDSTGRSTNRS